MRVGFESIPYNRGFISFRFLNVGGRDLNLEVINESSVYSYTLMILYRIIFPFNYRVNFLIKAKYLLKKVFLMFLEILY